MIALLASVAFANPPTTAAIGQPAPAFSLTSTDGATVSLEAWRGKTVVLEWFNPDCPFVKYAHGPSGPLASQPARVSSDDVVWVAINSGAPGKQGAAPERNVAARTEYGMTYPVLLDPTGVVGKAYGATNTPGMYVVDPAGTLVYAGALDNAPNGTLSGDTLTNYVDAALADLVAGRPVATPKTKAYGCGVKYPD
jgi:hypothetical protein